MKSCDIILPTYQRRDALKAALEALHDQQIPPTWRIRIIICDDGASKNTQSVVGQFSWVGQWISPVILTLDHLGRSGARNAGIRVSDANVIFLLADDIFLQPDALTQHLQFHDEHEAIEHASLGYVMWDPCIYPSPLMEWMTHGGQQNNYDAVLGSVTCDPGSFFYGSHISVKREFFQQNLFNESITAYGWEDLELGSRLKALGLVLYVLHEAIGLHSKFCEDSALLERRNIL
jgi:GT2 family glycosyltransferase